MILHRLFTPSLGALAKSLGFGLALGLASPAAAETVSIALSWVPDVEFAGFFTALKQDVFANYGVEAEFFPGGPNAPDPIVSVAADRATIGQGLWIPLVNVLQKGEDYVVIAADLPISPGAIVSRGDTPILTAKDMQGKTILAQFPSLETELKAILQFNGLPPELTTKPTGFSMDPLLAGEGEGYTGFATSAGLMLEGQGLVEGKDFHVTLMADMGYPVAQSLFVVKRSTIETHRAALVGFLAAYLKGWQMAEADRDAATRLIVDDYGADMGLDFDLQRAILERTIPLMTAKGSTTMLEIPEEQQQRMIDFAALVVDGPIPERAQIFDMSLLHEAMELAQ